MDPKQPSQQVPPASTPMPLVNPPVVPPVPTIPQQQPVLPPLPETPMSPPAPQIPSIPPVQPATPTGQGNKEVAPLVMSQDMLRPSEAMPELHQEVKEAGVEVVSEVPTLTLEDKKAGLEIAKEAVPAPTQPTDGVTLPTAAQVTAVIKRNKVSDSITWMATLVLRQLKLLALEKKEKHV